LNLVRPAFSVPVTLLSTAVTGRDEYGNDVREATETPVDALAVWPRASDEQTQGRDTVIVGLTAVLPYGTEVHATDRLRFDGKVWEIEGEPGVWGPSPFTGNVAGVEVALTRVEG
jgi:head-tail adaptor